MNKPASTASRETQYKTRAHGYLVEARRILHRLATDREREVRRRAERSDILSEVKAILQHA